MNASERLTGCATATPAGRPRGCAELARRQIKSHAEPGSPVGAGHADKLNKARLAISYYETGAHKPRTGTSTELAVALDVEIDALLDDDSDDRSDDVAALRARQGLKQSRTPHELGLTV